MPSATSDSKRLATENDASQFAAHIGRDRPSDHAASSEGTNWAIVMPCMLDKSAEADLGREPGRAARHDSERLKQRQPDLPICSVEANGDSTQDNVMLVDRMVGHHPRHMIDDACHA